MLLDAAMWSKTVLLVCSHKFAMFHLADKMEQMLLLSAEERARMGERGRAKMILEDDEKLIIKAVGTLVGN